jgi:tetratricopeptide (TPR) repeat protein
MVLLFLVLGGGAELRGQHLFDDLPAPLEPLRPLSQQERDRRQARELYARAILCQRDDRLLEALRSLEQARLLDPEAAPVIRALVPIYLALGRHDEALASCRKAIDLDPADHESWYILARELHDLGQPREAIDALVNALKSPSLEDQFDLQVQMYYELGIWTEDARDYRQAEAAFRRVTEILKDHHEALLEMGPFDEEQIRLETAKTWERLGQVRTKAGMYTEAIAAFKESQKHDPARAARLSYHLAEVCLAQSKLDESLKYLDDYLRTLPPGMEAYELKITVLRRLKRDAEIVPALEQAAARDRHNTALQLLLARQYAREKRWADAERIYSKVAETAPSPELYRGLFTVWKDSQQPGKILSLLDSTLKAATSKEDGQDDDEAAQLSPRAAAAAARSRAMLPVLRDDPEMLKGVLETVGGELVNQRPRHRTTMRLLAVLAARSRQLPIAEQLYRQCLPIMTEQTESDIYAGLLDVLAYQGKHQEVASLARDGLKNAKATHLLIFHTKLAPALVKLGKDDEAIAVMDEAVKIADEPNRLWVHRLRVDIFRQTDKFDKAIVECNKLFKEFPLPGQVRDIRHSLSNIYSTMKDYPKAEELLRLILESDPNDATANNDLGYIMADQGKNLDEAERLIRKAIDLDLAEKKRGRGIGTDGVEASAAFIDSLGWVLFRLGKLDDAREQLEKASKLAGGEDDPVVWDHLGDVYWRLDDARRARAAWEKAIQLYDQEGSRRRRDERYQEIRHKLETLR